MTEKRCQPSQTIGERFRTAALAGAAIDTAWAVVSVKPKASLHGDLGTLEGKAINQHGQVVLAGTGKGLVADARLAAVFAQASLLLRALQAVQFLRLYQARHILHHPLKASDQKAEPRSTPRAGAISSERWLKSSPGPGSSPSCASRRS